MANEMKIHLQADYKTHNGFCPIYAPDGQLMSVEMLTHFTHAAANVSIPQEILTPQLNDQQRLRLMQDKINIISRHHDFFIQHNVNVVINIDIALAKTILESDLLLKKMHLLNCVELGISENFPGLKAGDANDYLQGLREGFSLSLNNYGAGQATSKAIFDDLFYRIKLDKSFIHNGIRRLSFQPFIGAILEHIKPHCQEVVVQGIDNFADLQTVRPFAFDGIQGAIFINEPEETLTRLLEAPYHLLEPAM